MTAREDQVIQLQHAVDDEQAAALRIAKERQASQAQVENLELQMRDVRGESQQLKASVSGLEEQRDVMLDHIAQVCV